MEAPASGAISKPSGVTQKDIDSAFDLLGLTSEQERLSFAPQVDPNGDQVPSKQFAVRLSNSSQAMPE